MNNVLIMLSTYNGGEFLREQLDSLYAQKNVKFHVLVRDDGSKDCTLEILEEYRRNYGMMDILSDVNYGAAKSFHLLAHYALTQMPVYDYYAFCDQDDVWFINKLQVSCEALRACCDNYKLFYGPAMLVDAGLNQLHSPCATIVNNLEANIFASRSLGCTQVFNRALLEKFDSLYSYVVNAKRGDFVPLHDAWMSLIAYSLSANVIVGKEPLMLYRQHGNNVVGANDKFMKRTLGRFKRFFGGTCPKSTKCKLVLDNIGKDMPEENFELIEMCANYKKNFISRLKLAACYRLYQYTLADNLGLFATIITGTF